MYKGTLKVINCYNFLNFNSYPAYLHYMRVKYMHNVRVKVSQKDNFAVKNVMCSRERKSIYNFLKLLRDVCL